MYKLNSDKYTDSEIINFITDNPEFSLEEKNILRNQIYSDNDGSTSLKTVLAALKDEVIKLPLLPEARRWYLQSPTELLEILNERYDNESDYIKPNIYSDKLFKDDQTLEKVIDVFLDMYRGSDNEKVVLLLYKILTIPRNLYVPLLNLLLLRLCTIEDLSKIEIFTEENIKKFIKKILFNNYLLSDQLYQYNKRVNVYNVKYNNELNFFEMAYLMYAKFNAKKYTPVESLNIVFTENVTEEINFKNCYTDEDAFKEAYEELLINTDYGIHRKLKILIEDDEDEKLNRLYALNFPEEEEILTSDKEIFSDVSVYENSRYSEFFTKLDRIIFKPLCEGLIYKDSYKLLINRPKEFSVAKIYKDYIMRLANFYFPYENSLRVISSLTESLVRDSSLLNIMKDNINDIEETSADLIYKIDTKLNKILLTKRFLICTDYNEENLYDFDSCVVTLMKKIKLFMKLLMAIYSMSSINLKVLKG